jgi:FlaA1/EpsC-like NDP-sugar epimerase
LFEELETSDERVLKTWHPKIFIGKIAPYPTDQVRQALFSLARLAKGGHEPQLRSFLNDFLPEAQLEVTAQTVITHQQEEPMLQQLSA